MEHNVGIIGLFYKNTCAWVVKMADTESGVCGTSGSSATSPNSATAVVYSSDSASESEQEDQSGTSAPPSLLSKLRAPQPSDFARKWRVPANPPPWGKHRSLGTTRSVLKSVIWTCSWVPKPAIDCNFKLFYHGCQEEQSVKSSSVKNHLRSSKHAESKKRLVTLQVLPQGETFPENQLVILIKFVRAFLWAGVPLSTSESLLKRLAIDCQTVTTCWI